MLETAAGQEIMPRCVRARTPTRVSLPLMRPSIMDRRFRCDAWVLEGEDGTLALCLGNYNLAQVAGLPLDVPHLNNLLDRLRQPPRRRCC
jgi:hypothetical protein